MSGFASADPAATALVVASRLREYMRMQFLIGIVFIFLSVVLVILVWVIPGSTVPLAACVTVLGIVFALLGVGLVVSNRASVGKLILDPSNSFYAGVPADTFPSAPAPASTGTATGGRGDELA
jgi:hypothetical protein